MLDVMGKDKNEFKPPDGPEIDTLFLIDRGRSANSRTMQHAKSEKSWHWFQIEIHFMKHNLLCYKMFGRLQWF